MQLIYHITTFTSWGKARKAGRYTASSLVDEGFIHCSTAGQVVSVANELYAGQSDLVLLVIDERRVRPEVRYEDCYATGQLFPHIYGPLNLAAVVGVLPFPAGKDGRFQPPPLLSVLEVPLLAHDPETPAFIEPSTVLPAGKIPAYGVLCFFQDVLQGLVAAGKLRPVYALGSEIGENPVYVLEIDGQELMVCHPGVGAPLAAGFMEELIALGGHTFIACGGCGALDGNMGLGHLVVPTAAVRDEGTSYHYLPPGREVSANPAGVAAIEQVLQRDQVPYEKGKTWTTDGVYRETPARINRRRAEGCLTVEMEAASLFAVAQFREVVAAQILYAGDDLSNDTWDSRHWQKQASVREKLFWLAAEACLLLMESGK
jgi:uncharacterized protein (DUF952 family)/uridine phosphorylase